MLEAGITVSERQIISNNLILQKSTDVHACAYSSHSSIVSVLLFYVHSKHLWTCRDGHFIYTHFSWAGLDLPSG